MTVQRQRPTHVFAQPVNVRTPRANSDHTRLVVGLVVATVVTAAAVVVALSQILRTAQVDFGNIKQVTLGPFTLSVSAEVPPTTLIVISVATLVGVASCAFAFEAIAALLTVSPKRDLLASYREQFEFTEPGPLRLTIVVPAHNEEASLPGTLDALKKQTRPPDRVIVVADNCTDRTVAIAEEMGYESFETVDNTHKKGGALNQALREILVETDARDVIMIMDADTRLSERFLETGISRFANDEDLSAVGGVFYGEDGEGLIGQFQRNEYARYSLQIRSRHGRVFVLTGTASMFRAEVLLDVAAARGVFIPGDTGNVYDTAALTEDNELTLALKSLGASMNSPIECKVTTEIMPTWKALWTQRKRWQRGALENLAAYGFTRATIRYWGQQVGIGYGTIALNLALLLMLITFLAVDTWIWFPFWLVITAIFVVERVVTAWSGGIKARLLAVLLFPELAYDVFLQVVFVTCLVDIARAKRTTWGHVVHTAQEPSP